MQNRLCADVLHYKLFNSDKLTKDMADETIQDENSELCAEADWYKKLKRRIREERIN